MKKFLVFILMLAISPLASAHSALSDDIVVKYQGRKKMVLISRMLEVSKHYYDCSPEDYNGVIQSVVHNDEGGGYIVAFTLALNNGRRLWIKLDDHLYSRLPNVDESWLYTLIAKGKRVRVAVYLCGAGGNNIVVDEIKAL